MVRAAQKAYCEKLIQNGRDISSLWKAINNITKGTDHKSLAIPQNLTADSFNKHFLSVADKLAPTRTKDNPYIPPQTLVNFCREKTSDREPFSVPLVTVHEVGKLVSKMKSKKSSGPDEISPRILKMSLPYIVSSLTYIYNLCIEQNTFPAEWKIAKVIPLPKTKDHSDVNNYRPISLLSVLSKPLERHIHKHLLGQSGFRPGHSCHTALTCMTEHWLSAINQSMVNGAVFLDFKKAFDLVNHEILCRKLACYIGQASFFKSYLKERKQKVLLNGEYSSVGWVSHGVPQGSVLGPLLFCIFINDLPMHLSSEDIKCELFADDSTLHTADTSITDISKRLQTGVDKVVEWCHENCMVLNPSKTESMVITSRQKHQLSPLVLNISVDEKPIHQVSEHRLLGVIIDSSLSWQPHINFICKAISRNLFLLSKLKYFLDIDARHLFFTAHIRSHIDYASTLWDGASENTLKRLNSLYRRAPKLILPNPTLSTDEKLRQLKILPLNDHLKYNKYVTMYKVRTKSFPVRIFDPFTPSSTRYLSSKCLFIVPKTRVDIFKTSLLFSGSVSWNALPPNIKCAPSLSTFKARTLLHLHKFLGY